MALNPLAGYETIFGTKKVMVAEPNGPTSYPTGGVTIKASDLGWGGFDFVYAPNAQDGFAGAVGNSYSGTYEVIYKFSTTSSPQGCVQSVIGQWFVAATGAEVTNATNLSAEVHRVVYIGV